MGINSCALACMCRQRLTLQCLLSHSSLSAIFYFLSVNAQHAWRPSSETGNLPQSFKPPTHRDPASLPERRSPNPLPLLSLLPYMNKQSRKIALPQCGYSRRASIPDSHLQMRDDDICDFFTSVYRSENVPFWLCPQLADGALCCFLRFTMISLFIQATCSWSL